MGPWLSFLVFGALALGVTAAVLWGIMVLTKARGICTLRYIAGLRGCATQYRTALNASWQAANRGVTPRVGDSIMRMAPASMPR